MLKASTPPASMSVRAVATIRSWSAGAICRSAGGPNEPRRLERAPDEPPHGLVPAGRQMTALVPEHFWPAPVLPQAADLMPGVGQAVGQSGVDETPLARQLRRH